MSAVNKLEREAGRRRLGIQRSFQNVSKIPHIDPRITDEEPWECAKCLPAFLLGIKAGCVIFCINVIKGRRPWIARQRVGTSNLIYRLE